MVTSTLLLLHICPKLGEHLAPKWEGRRVRTWIEIFLEKHIELHGNEKEEEAGEDTGGLVRQTVPGGINEFCDIICCILEENRILGGGGGGLEGGASTFRPSPLKEAERCEEAVCWDWWTDAVDSGGLGCCLTDGAGWEWCGGSTVKGNMFLGVTVQGMGTPEVNLPLLECSAQIALLQRNSSLGWSVKSRFYPRNVLTG